jgi:16S rRNA (adenine1518-N6/adenine1519-N6)-dimethyltransferase
MRGTDRPRRTDRPVARRRFGQHFLEPAWARKVVAAIQPAPEDVFIEIGPGPGAISRPLADASAALVACEIDRDLAAALRAEQIPRVHVVEGDFLTLPLEQLRDALSASAPEASVYRVAGNLPYNVAAPIMFRLVELSRLGLALRDATIMLQREVADRLLASPGTRDYGLLTVLMTHRASATRLLNLPPGAFRPPPKVQSSVVRLTFHDADPPVADESVLAAVTAAVFSRRRKTVSNALLAYGGVTPETASRALISAGIDPVRRPETLAVAELCRVADAIASARPANPTKAALPPVL